MEEGQKTRQRSLVSLAFVSQATAAAASISDDAAAIAAPQGTAVGHPLPRPFHLWVLLIRLLTLKRGGDFFLLVPISMKAIAIYSPLSTQSSRSMVAPL